MGWQSVGLYRDTLPQNTAVSKHSCVQKFLYPNIPVSKHYCIQPLQKIMLKKSESIGATKFPFELFLCLTTACLNEFARFVNVNCPNKAWSVIFPAQTATQLALLKPSCDRFPFQLRGM